MSLSLIHCKKKFFEITQEERKIRNEHERLLQASIDMAIEQGQQEVFYTVPSSLLGAFPIFNVDEMTLWLLKKCRRGKLKVELVHQNPNVIHLWGWHEENWIEKDGPIDPKTTTKAKALPKPLNNKNKNKTTPEQISIMGQRKKLSERLKKELDRQNKK